jgi:hypothetical protein
MLVSRNESRVLPLFAFPLRESFGIVILVLVIAHESRLAPNDVLADCTVSYISL